MRTAFALLTSLTVSSLSLSAAAEPSVHALHAELRPMPEARARDWRPPPQGVLGPKTWVYGYLPYWIGGLEKIAWDKLSHVAIFNVALASNGSLTGVSNWNKLAKGAMTMGAPYGVRVHLTITCFEPTVMNAVLPQPALRAKVVAALGDLVDAEGAHGVSVDFELMPAALRDDLTAFIVELKQRVAEVTVATPAVDWSHAYDYPKLAAAADALFIMGYDYHWSTGSPGPVAPLKGGMTWNIHALDWTVADYLKAGAPKEKLVLGLPLYGYRWPTTNTKVPGAATGKASSVLMADAVVEIGKYSAHFDEETQTPYYFPSMTSQVFYDDISSLSTKIGWAMGQELSGIGFWALGYDGGDPAFWSMISEHTQGSIGGSSSAGSSGAGGAGGGSQGSGGVGGGMGESSASGGPSANEGESNSVRDAPGGEEVEGLGFGCGCAVGPGAPALGPLAAVLLALGASYRRASRRRFPG